VYPLIGNLRLVRKLALLGVIALTSTVALLALHVDASLDEIAVTDTELSGFEPSRAVLDVMRLTQQHRGLSSAALGGQSEAEPQRQARQAEVDKAVKHLTTVVERDIDDPRVRDEWRQAADNWHALARSITSRQIAGAESMARHTALIASQIELHDRVIDHFGLTLDPEAATYFMVIASLQHMPRLTELLGQARGRGAFLLAQQKVSPEERAALQGLNGQVASQLRTTRVTMDKAFRASAALETSLGGAADKLTKQADEVLRLARTEILEPAALTFPAAEYFRQTSAAIDTVYAVMDQATQSLKSELLARRAATLRSKLLLLGGVALMIAIGAWFGWVIAQSITRPAAAARQAARRIAEGDLTGDVPAGGRDEMGELLAAMRDMQSSLIKVVGDVRGNADSVATASAQIAQGNADLSQRTEEQASALQQTAATMEQLGATARSNTDSARQANQLAQGASDVAAQGGQAVGRVVDTMRDISESSRKITEIIGTIDGIAFQTNILALNAAVEAARAGEQGRGFAVVAGEVRVLAQRSAEAAKQIKGLIAASAERVGQGVDQVDQAGQTMDQVRASIKRVADIVSEISSASVEQSAGVGQVGETIGQMDQVTQQNAALVEQSAAAAESLKGQASALVHAVRAFKLAHGSPTPT
jgi:methyl-accepting chemotaxis protein